MKVNLNDVIESMELEGEMLQHYYNKDTGIIMYIEDSSSAAYKAEDIENIESFEQWEQELIRALYDFKENPQNYIQLPDENELDEYKIMKEFSKTYEGIEIKDSVQALKDEIKNKGLIDNWYDYRENAEYNIAKQWCEKNNIQYVE